jgi:hypothetical protein
MDEAYSRLARHLDSLPNEFRLMTADCMLAKLFTPEEADLAARLRRTPEIPARIAERIGADPEPLAAQLKGMARRGLIAISRTPDGLAYGALPFVVGIYENLVGELDVEFARLFEGYYRQAFGRAMAIAPSVHRVIPVQESVRTGMEIHPFESARQSCTKRGVTDCICRNRSL